MNNQKRHVAVLLAGIFIATLTGTAEGQTAKGRSRRRRSVVHVTPPHSSASPTAAAVTTASGLTYLITKHGTGRQPQTSETVIVHYTGLLTDGKKFDSSLDRNEPFRFKLGAHQVIKGWDEGIAQLHVGDRAVLMIPPQLGYGQKGAGAGVIPPDATLILIVELVDVKAAESQTTSSSKGN